MFTPQAAFSGISVDDQAQAKDFYTVKLGLELKNETMGLTFILPNDSGKLFLYAKPDHQPANYTVLNFVVDDIDVAVDALVTAGISFEHYDFGNGAKTDDKGVMRGKAVNRGPDIAWFKDPAGNTLSILQN